MLISGMTRSKLLLLFTRDAVYQAMSTVELRARVADGDRYCAKGELQRFRAPLCTFRRAFPF